MFFLKVSSKMDTVDLCSDSERSTSPNDVLKEYDFIGSLLNEEQINNKFIENDSSNDTIPWQTSGKEIKPTALHVLSSDSEEEKADISLLNDIYCNVASNDAALMSCPSTSSFQTKSSSEVLSTDSGEIDRKAKRKSRGNKENKEDERKKRKRIQQEIKSTKPGECMKFITMECSSDLLNSQCFSKVFEVICPTGVLINVTHKHKSSITWTRKSHNHKEMDLSNEPHIVMILQQSEIVELLKSKTLPDYIKSIEGINNKEGTKTLILYGMETYFRKNKHKGNAQWRREENVYKSQKEIRLNENDMDYYLAKLSLDDGISWCRAETPDDLANLLLHLTKAVAEVPYKRNKYRQDLEVDFYMRGDNRDCVPVDANGNGLLRLWSHSLCKFPHAGREVGLAVCQQWNSPTAMCQALQAFEGNVTEAVTLLSEIPVRRDNGPTSGSKRLGPALSKKLYTYFTATDGDTLLE